MLLEGAIAEADKDISAGAKERKELEETIARTTAVLEKVDRATTRNARRLLLSFEALPEPLKVRLETAATRMREVLSTPAKQEKTLERLQLVTTFAADLGRLQSSVHVVDEILDIEGQGPREMKVLYIGSAVGYYVSPDGLEAGLVVREKETWRAIPRTRDLAPRVRRALDVFLKKRPAELIELPVPAPREAAAEKGGK